LFQWFRKCEQGSLSAKHATEDFQNASKAKRRGEPFYSSLNFQMSINSGRFGIEVIVTAAGAVAYSRIQLFSANRE